MTSTSMLVLGRYLKLYLKKKLAFEYVCSVSVPVLSLQSY